MPATLYGEITADVSWAANTSTGDKTAVIPDYVNGISGTMVTALNLVSTGLGTELSSLADCIVATRKKAAALQEAARTSKQPNA